MRSRRKYAAIGESVRIVTPKQFIRRGYPLSIKDVMNQEFEEIEKDFERMFAALENRPVPDLRKTAMDEDGWLVDLAVTEQHSCSATVHGMLCAAIAAYRLEKKNFGGGARQIIEVEPGVFERGQVWKVVSKKLVKTGKRYPSRSYYSSYSGEYDYEPGGLENEQTHCVYEVSQYDERKAKILAAHCEFILWEKDNGERPNHPKEGLVEIQPCPSK